MTNQEICYKMGLALHSASISWFEMTLPSGQVVYSEDKVTTLGYKPADFQTVDDFVKVIHPEDLKSITKSFTAIMDETNNVFEVLYRIKDKSGNYRRFYDKASVTRDGKVTKVVGITIDSTTLQDFAYRMTQIPVSTNEKYHEVKDLPSKN